MFCQYTNMSSTNPPRPTQAIDREAFRQRVSWVQEKSEMTKAAFAESIGITKSNYRQVELGKRLLTVEQIYNAFVVHGIPMEYLLTGRQTDLPAKYRS